MDQAIDDWILIHSTQSPTHLYGLFLFPFWGFLRYLVQILRWHKKFLLASQAIAIATLSPSHKDKTLRAAGYDMNMKEKTKDKDDIKEKQEETKEKEDATGGGQY